MSKHKHIPYNQHPCQEIPDIINNHYSCDINKVVENIINDYPKIKEAILYLKDNYKIISISITKELIFTIEFNCKITNSKYVPKIIDYNNLT